MLLIHLRNTRYVMRFQVFKISPDYSYLIAESKIKFLELIKCNILTLLGASLKDVNSSVPIKD